MILYSAITKGSLILCEYTQSNEDFSQLISKQLKFIKNKEEKQQFKINQQIMYLLQNNQYNFMCVMQITQKNEVQDQSIFAYSFLKDISERFQLMTQSEGIDKGQFTKVIAEIMSQYNQKTENAIEEQKLQIKEIQNQQELKLKQVFQKTQGIQKNDNFGYSVNTCKSIFFVINLFLAGILVELFTKFDKYL
ncbi:unnamed protein product [Paramecium sonneborni]|uniref:Longin domain-containing protein n=1 Tax=Paramecium sonneborni TaxID=65129 RepID=A0A8S1M8H7_9CILI|nr:unnamed protein product [Paramecium sonneborni]